MSDGPPAHAAEDAARLVASPRPWGAEDETLVCRQVRHETHDVKTFVLAAPEPRRFAHRPGQFLTFAFEIGGETLHRCYTIASPPTRPEVVEITVKRVPGGPVSNWLHDELRPGRIVMALGPMGEFSCFHPAPHAEVAGWPAEPAGGPRSTQDGGVSFEADLRSAPRGGEVGGTPRYLFLSGGSGVTPLMSMARTFHDLGLARDIVFVHAARSPADIVFGDELRLMARASPVFRFWPICEADAPGEPWSGLRGRLSPAMLEMVAPDLAERKVFVCGPAPFMAAVRGMLAARGFDMRRHREESFDFAELGAAEKAEACEAEAALDPATPPLALRTYMVEFARTKRRIEVREDQTVLDAARKQGIRLPSSCTKGICGTCKSKILSGTLDMRHGGGIRPREIEAGLALLCCSKPTSDLVVER